MRARSLVFAALGAACMLGTAAPAYADHREPARREVRGDRDRHRDDWRAGYAAPPVVVSPPGYYAPPPIAYSPGITIGVTIP
ncbi:MAG TPA: hypothetical protein VGG99_29715 [Acetobacteraceae bacterium]|jgi:hypothetical protein